MADLQAANVFTDGALHIDDYDRVIFDDLVRTFPAWSSIGIDKRPAVGDFTNGFQQTGLGTARTEDKRTLTFSATSAARSARTPQEIKAIVRDIQFGIYDRSVYKQQGQKYGDLTAKDVQDVYSSMLFKWCQLFYDGNASGTPTEFNGLKALVTSSSTCAYNVSVVKTIQERVTTMMNTTSRDCMPTDIIINARVRQLIAQEYRKVGDRMPEAVNTRGERVGAIDTSAGILPLHIDRFNASVAGTPVTYPTWIISRDKLSWQYIEPLNTTGPDPKLLAFNVTNVVTYQYKGFMFGALDLLGAANHHYRLNVEERTAVVDMTT